MILKNKCQKCQKDADVLISGLCMKCYFPGEASVTRIVRGETTVTERDDG